MRSALLAVVIAGFMLQHAWAQADGPPGAPPPECQQLLNIRHDLEKHAQAIMEANRQKASAMTACQLFKSYLAVDLRMIRAIDAIGAQCGWSSQIAQQYKESHTKATRLATYACADAGAFLDDKKRPVGDFWRPDELDRHFGRGGSFERGR
jgi:hypothetical protein